MTARALGSALLLATTVAATPLLSNEKPAGQWWVIRGPRATVLNDELHKQVEVETGLNPGVPVYSPDRRHIAVTNVGAFTSRVAFKTMRREYWPEPGSSSGVTILKADGLEAVARRTLRFRPIYVHFTDNDTLVVVSAGQVSSNAEKQILPAITVLSVPGGEVRQEMEMQVPPVAFWYHEGTRVLHVIAEKFGSRGAEIITVDPAAGKSRRTPLPSDVFGVHETGRDDSRYLRLEDSVAVLNATGEIGPLIRAGKDQVFFTPMPEGNRYLLAGTTGKEAKLLVLDGGRVQKEVQLDKVERVVIAEKTPRIIVCGDKAGVILDRETLAEVGKLTLPGDYIDVLLDPEERNLYVYEGGSVSVIDVAQNRRSAKFGVGSGFKKFMASGSPYYVREGPVVRQALPTDEAWPVFTMAFAPSGSHLFVYNAAARDVTIVDTATQTPKQKVGVGENVGRAALWQLPGGKQLIAFKKEQVLLFDADGGRVLAEKDFGTSLISWDEGLDAVLVRTTSGTTAYRASSLEVMQDFGPELAITAQDLDDDRRGTFFFNRERRLILTMPKGARMYDYDLKPLGTLEGVTAVDRIIRVTPPADRCVGTSD